MVFLMEEAGENVAMSLIRLCKRNKQQGIQARRSIDDLGVLTRRRAEVNQMSAHCENQTGARAARADGSKPGGRIEYVILLISLYELEASN